MALRENVLAKRIHNDFAGGVNLYLGPRQIKENESPVSTDCDFKGKGGVGARQGYTQLGTPSSYNSGCYGMAEYHTSTLDQLIKFVSNGSNIILSYSTNGGSTWTDVTGTTFTNALNMDVIQAVASTTVPYTGEDGTLFSFNGTDAMKKYNGSTWSAHTGAATLLYGAFFDKRLWGVDPTYKDTLKFSTQTPDATKSLDFVSNGTSSNPGTITILPGAGAKISGIKVFKDALYVFLNGAIKGIYKITPASTANTFTISQITNTIGSVAHRSIAQVENDLYFAADDGIYSLGEVGTYTSIRTTNKSLRIQQAYDALSGTLKAKLVGRYFNFKYHLFYSQFGSNNDSCLVYDIRYLGWQQWTNIAGNDATTFTNNSNTTTFYFGHPTNSKIYQLYSGSTDDGTAIASVWYSKSFDEEVPDLQKQYMDTTYIFGALGGSVSVAVIFNDSEVTSSKTITQTKPQGGFGRDVFGRNAFGDAVQNISVATVINQPQRLRAKGQKFAVQYRVTSSASWRLDAITQTFIPFSHYKFPAANKL